MRYRFKFWRNIGENIAPPADMAPLRGAGWKLLQRSTHMASLRDGNVSGMTLRQFVEWIRQPSRRIESVAPVVGESRSSWGVLRSSWGVSRSSCGCVALQLWVCCTVRLELRIQSAGGLPIQSGPHHGMGISDIGAADSIRRWVAIGRRIESVAPKVNGYSSAPRACAATFLGVPDYGWAGAIRRR